MYSSSVTTKLSHSRVGVRSTWPCSLRTTVRRSSDSSVAYVFGWSIRAPVPSGEMWQNRPRLRVDPERLDEHARALLEGVERLRLPARPVEREHQLLAKALAERILADERLELAHDLGVPARLEVGVDPLLEDGQPELLQAADLGLREGLERELAERRSAPEGERLAELRRPLVGRGRLRLGGQGLRPGRIEPARVDTEQVSGRLRHENVRPEQLPQLGDEVLKGGRSRLRRVLTPERVDQAVGRDGAAGIDEEEREQGPLLRPAERQRFAVRAHLDRPEDAELELAREFGHEPVLAPPSAVDHGPLAARWRRVSGQFGPRPTVAAWSHAEPSSLVSSPPRCWPSPAGRRCGRRPASRTRSRAARRLPKSSAPRSRPPSPTRATGLEALPRSGSSTALAAFGCSSSGSARTPSRHADGARCRAWPSRTPASSARRVGTETCASRSATGPRAFTSRGSKPPTAGSGSRRSSCGRASSARTRSPSSCRRSPGRRTTSGTTTATVRATAGTRAGRSIPSVSPGRS